MRRGKESEGWETSPEPGQRPAIILHTIPAIVAAVKRLSCGCPVGARFARRAAEIATGGMYTIVPGNSILL